MSASRVADPTPRTDDEDLDALVVQDPYRRGRHNARVADSLTKIWLLVAAWKQTGDVDAVAKRWDESRTNVETAIRYYERHRDLFDAKLLLDEEEQGA